MSKIGFRILTIIFGALGLLATCLLILVKIYRQWRRRYFDLEQDEEKNIILEQYNIMFVCNTALLSLSFFIFSFLSFFKFVTCAV